MQKRNTIQRKLVVDAVRELHCHATADDVYELIAKEHPTIGKGTVYRNLMILAENGEIKRVEIPNGADRFDHTLYEHYHVRCIKCGGVYDVDMDALPHLDKRIHDTHGIKILDYDILFKGICPDCQREQ